jgi:hypothetical protein
MASPVTFAGVSSWESALTPPASALKGEGEVGPSGPSSG